MTFHLAKTVAAMEQRFDESRLNCQRPVVSSYRFIVTSKSDRGKMIALDGEKLIKLLQRFRQLPQQDERSGTDVEKSYVSVVGPEAFTANFECGLVGSHLTQDGGVIFEELWIRRLYRQ